MGTKTGIEWTDATWNPIRGCSRVSEGCRHCYAEHQAHRFSGAGQAYEGLTRIVNGHPVWTGIVRLAENHLLDPLRWRGRKLYHPDFPRSVGSEPGMRIFVNSMSDLFHENVPDEWIDRVFAVMALCPQHIFQVLTKRPERMRDYLIRRQEGDPKWRIHAVMEAALTIVNESPRPLLVAKEHFENWPLPNVWLGASVENQTAADERIPLLLQTTAAVRFISAEPLLGSIDLKMRCGRCGYKREACHCEKFNHAWGKSRDWIKLPQLDWVIVGGESGPGARPMHPDWARSLRDQCRDAGVPFFFKQWGEWAPQNEGARLSDLWLSPGGETRGDYLTRGDACLRRVGKKAAGALLDGREWREYPRP